jgi:LemA protein
VTWILLLFAAGVVAFAVVVFNDLIGLRNRARGSWSDIDVQLKRRHDLVQNLVETVTGYAAHERSVLEEVVRLRGEAERARSTGRPGESGRAESLLNARLPGLFALAEAYPDLKASDRFLDLQTALVRIEDDLQNARRYYNAVVRDLNTRIQSFPHLLIARAFRFAQRDFFELESAAERAAPHVGLGR